MNKSQMLRTLKSFDVADCYLNPGDLTNIMVTCCQAVHQSSDGVHDNLQSWLSRKGRRKTLRGRLTTRDARRALGGLIDLAVAVVDAVSWPVAYHSPPLPLEDPPTRGVSTVTKARRASTRGKRKKAI